MSQKRKPFDPRAPPERWLNCPRKSEVIADQFIAFKTPLSAENFDVPQENRFTIEMLLSSMKSNNVNIGLIIDLTNTERFYDAEKEIKGRGIKYMKIKCSGHDGTPNEEQTKLFNEICSNFESKFPTQKIGVHCTHGFNRTGFLICTYLISRKDFSVDAAIACFARLRPPGIYKQDYIQELYKRFGDPKDEVPKVNVYPTWEADAEHENDDEGDEDGEASTNGSSDNQKPKKRKREFIKQNPEFCVKLNGVVAVTDLAELTRVQQKVQSICKWERAGFPGSQPVSMDINNYTFLAQKGYMVSWKADGTRYLMYIAGKDFVYMLDRDNSAFRVHNLTFPKRKEPHNDLSNTLLDGEFVLDNDPSRPGEKMPRYLVYDIIQFEEHFLGSYKFKERLQCYEKEIIGAREIAKKSGRIQRDQEPFGVRSKQFFDLKETRRLLSKEFTESIPHETDGLIFQPKYDPYEPGQCDSILKWKPPSMNSVDFKLIITELNQPDLLPKDRLIGNLYCGGYEQPFSRINLTKALRALNGKIIECKHENNQWTFMRERTDKSYPNALKTAVSVCGSIKNPVTEEMLFHLIDQIELQRQMPPPAVANVIK